MKKIFIKFLFFLFFTSYSYACSLLSVPIGSPVSVAQNLGNMGRSTYTLNGNEHTQQDFMNLTSKMTDQELAQVTYDVKGNSVLKADLDAKKNDGVIKNNLDTRVTDEADRAKLFKLEISLFLCTNKRSSKK